MLDIAVLLLLIMGFFIGLKRGFIMQLIHLTGYIIAYIAANIYCDDLASKLILWIPYPGFGDNTTLKVLTNSTNIEAAFYRAIAFIIIFITVKMFLLVIGRMLSFIARLPILRQLNVWVGGIFGFCEIYLIVFILLYMAALVPMDLLQNTLSHSIMAEAMIKHTPVLSDQMKQIWIEYAGTATSL
jgi:uncharacterized membrane protein required for colicin V production